MFVVGTAGHVDHGKSTLVKALTGIDPDRLQEEQAREMTIDLGFAWLTLPSGRDVSVVDVPGHERFIKNMLAGVGGIDAAVLVIAADEGVMPQTAEHLAILDLLNVSRGVVALTKQDLVDEEWLDLVREEVAERLRGTSLENAPLVPVSARKRTGLPDLLAALDDVLSRSEQRPDSGVPRLPVDRVFSVQGFGTVVTGTLLDGGLRVGQEVEILPSRRKSRVRGLQIHKQKLEEAAPGRRLAVNLGGVAVDDLRRGDVVMPVGALQPTSRFDAKIRLTADAPRDLEHGQKLDLFVGASEATVSVSLLDADQLGPGESGYAQVRASEPLVLLRGDRFILRQPSPSITVGGGTVLDTRPRRHRRKTEETLAAMHTLERGSPQDLVLSLLARVGPTEHGTVIKAIGEHVAPVLDEMRQDGEIELATPQAVATPASVLWTRAQWGALVQRVRNAVSAYHTSYPLRTGMPKEELKSRLRLTTRTYAQALAGLVEREVLAEQGAVVRLPEFEVRLDGAAGAEAARVIGLIESGGHTPPSASETGAEPELLQALVEAGRLVKLNDSVYYAPRVYDEMVRRVLERIDQAGVITVADARDMFGASRKYALALLEHLDATRVTLRRGDERIRR